VLYSAFKKYSIHSILFGICHRIITDLEHNMVL